MKFDMFDLILIDSNDKIMKSTEDDVVDGDEQQFYYVADASHNGKSQGA